MTDKVSLYDKQRWAFFSPATELLFGGAAGPGKSFLLRMSAIRWCEFVPGVQVYLFRRTFPDLKSNHLRGPTSFINLLSADIESGRVKYNKQDNELVWKETGSRIALCHCQHEDDVIKYQGAEIHVLMMDELTHFTEFQYRFLRGRVRCVGLDVPEKFSKKIPRVEAGSNPGGIGHSWVKNTWELGSDGNKKPMEIWETPELEGGMMRQFIPALAEDNPALLRDDPNYFKRLQGLGSDTLVKAMSEGDWDIFAGQYFTKWRASKHIVEGYQIEKHWDLFGGFDWGFNHPYVFGLYAVDEDGMIVKFRECGDRGKTIEEASQQIKDQLPSWVEPEDLMIFAGHDCWAKRDGGPTIADRFADAGIHFNRCNNDRIQGANTLRERLEWNETKEPQFRVTKNCWRTIKQLPSMIIDEKRPEDVRKVDATQDDVWSGDDAYDETRYALHTFLEASKEDPNKKYTHLKASDKDFWKSHIDEEEKKNDLTDFYKTMF